MNENMIMVLTQEKSYFVVKEYEVDGKVYYNWPVPPGFEVTGNFALTTRLFCTKGGKYAWWESANNETVRSALNRAPYNPLIRAVVNSFVWWPPRQSEDMLRYTGLLENFVVQGGSGVLNWKANVVGPLPDQVRGAIEPAVQRVIRAWGADYEQGNLHVYKYGHLESSDPCHPRSGVSKIKNFWKLFNHTLCGQASIAGPRVFDIGGVATYVALISPMMPKGLSVLSADHPFESIHLEGGRSYILTHRIPEGDND